MSYTQFPNAIFYTTNLEKVFIGVFLDRDMMCVYKQ